MNITIAVPIYNGGALWRESAESIYREKIKNNQFDVLVIDSESKDQSALIAREFGFSVLTIPSSDFNHGGTRNLAVEKSVGDIVIFLTQDAIPCSGFIDEIAAVFKDERVAVAYGRQLPHLNANPLAEHARTFNYRNRSYISSLKNKDEFGIKTVFTSNSFAAYRKSVFNTIGGFPANTILSEDMYFAAKVIMAGYKVCYCAEAKVRHSHNYTPLEEFKRYFDIGVFHHDESWIRDEFSGAGGEGIRFIISEFKFLLKKYPIWIPRACVHNFFKIVGYKLGQNYKRLPYTWIPTLSMHKRFWK